MVATTSDARAGADVTAALREAPPGAGAVLTIDLDAVAANWRLLAARSGGAECAAVVKADAYGLGADRVGPALWDAGARTFFVAHPDEALALRAVLPAARIAVLHGAPAGAEDELAAAGLLPVLSTPAGIDRWAALARRLERPLPAFIQIDTGMNRLGLEPADVTALAADPGRLAGIPVAAWMSHLASPEVPDSPLTDLQLKRFRQAVAKLPPAPLSLASSSAIFRGGALLFDLTRPGAALYGVNPTPEVGNPMRPVVALHGRILQVRTVPPGEGIGYGATFGTTRQTKVATLSIGYADGFMRSLSNAGHVLIGGVPAPVAGRVSMDLMTVDATEAPPDALREGGFATLIGPHLDVDTVAAAAGTIGYEVLTALGRRYHRVYLGGSGSDDRGRA